jgi:hypothetical protein
MPERPVASANGFLCLAPEIFEMTQMFDVFIRRHIDDRWAEEIAKADVWQEHQEWRRIRQTITLEMIEEMKVRLPPLARDMRRIQNDSARLLASIHDNGRKRPPACKSRDSDSDQPGRARHGHAGSYISQDEARTFYWHAHARRLDLIESGKVQLDDSKNLTFIEDVEFESWTEAAAVVCGYNVNGKDKWQPE